MNTQNNQETVSKTANVVLVILFLSVALFFSLKRVDSSIKNKAIYECAITSRFEQTNEENKTKVSYPVADIYKQCLKDKGILR